MDCVYCSDFVRSHTFQLRRNPFFATALCPHGEGILHFVREGLNFMYQVGIDPHAEPAYPRLRHDNVVLHSRGPITDCMQCFDFVVAHVGALKNDNFFRTALCPHGYQVAQITEALGLNFTFPADEGNGYGVRIRPIQQEGGSARRSKTMNNKLRGPGADMGLLGDVLPCAAVGVATVALMTASVYRMDRGDRKLVDVIGDGYLCVLLGTLGVAIITGATYGLRVLHKGERR